MFAGRKMWRQQSNDLYSKVETEPAQCFSVQIIKHDKYLCSWPLFDQLCPYLKSFSLIDAFGFSVFAFDSSAAIHDICSCGCNMMMISKQENKGCHCKNKQFPTPCEK